MLLALYCSCYVGIGVAGGGVVGVAFVVVYSVPSVVVSVVSFVAAVSVGVGVVVVALATVVTGMATL